ncbi:S-4TM family putative pore-forming effector [Cellulosilyticum sp. ST5]|uniref:S-4TM family putative pore-forming effector n=1 Tax=Cellulosilyticum sp. ST5 TaxID=3055805 RepID=UPI0039775CD1
MGNTICDRQNEDKCIYYLAAQKQLYNEAKKLDLVVILFSVIFPISLAILQDLIENTENINVVSYALSIMSMLISFFISSSISEKKSNAAEIQQHFDVYVYQMPWDSKLFGKHNNITCIVSEKSKLLLNNPKEKEKLLGWYPPAAGTVDLTKGILICQKENFYWDVSLRKRFRLTSLIVIGIFGIGIFGIGMIKNESVAILLSRFAFILPMLRWLLETIKQLNKDIKNLEEIDNLVKSPDIKEIENLQEIQSKIYAHRKSCYTIPNKFYQRYKDNDEDMAHRIASMDT